MYVRFAVISLRLKVVDGDISFVRIAGNQALLLIFHFDDIQLTEESFASARTRILEPKILERVTAK